MKHDLKRFFYVIFSALARLPALNSYARTPSLVWKLGWTPTPFGELKTHLPPLPVDYLKDKDVLKEFVSRINTLGISITIQNFISV